VQEGTVDTTPHPNGALLHTIRGSVDEVAALALGRDGTLYSGGAAWQGSSKVRLEMW
jgi:hypothetical protein